MTLPAMIVLGLSIAAGVQSSADSQNRPTEDLPLTGMPPASHDVPLSTSQRLELDNALAHHDYKRAETLLVEETERNPTSVRTAKLLAIAAGVFFLDGKYVNSVIAWKKSEAIAPLDEPSRFTLAMAYIHLNRRDWARPELQKLMTEHPQNPLYLYWLARLDYDLRNYAAAIAKFQKVIQLDPKMMRAYDGLGLCHDYVGQLDAAIADYQRATELNRAQSKPSPWPDVDFAVALIEKNQLADAERTLREAIRYDAQLPQAHFELGRVLDAKNREGDAIEEFKRASELDPAYPEPHYRMSRIYRRLGKNQQAQEETNRFLQLKKAAETQSSSNLHTPRPQ
jgi:tetratricopeptide (TPR) repeat protein